jgi:hypothetical protein
MGLVEQAGPPRPWRAVSARGEGFTKRTESREAAARQRSPQTARARLGAGGTEVARMLRTPQPPPERKFRLDRNLDPDQLRHVNAMSTGRTPGLTLLGSNELEPSTARVPTQYEIVSMEESSFVFDTKSSRFADVRADNWREQLSGPVRSPQPPGSPSNSAVLKHTGSRNRRNMHGKLKTAKHV